MRHLITAFECWRGTGEPLVLATVFHTEGSTYSKAGGQLLMTPDGDYQGLLSGGCLEGDLLEHARGVLAEGRARVVGYDMRDPTEDELWGLGLGCDGALDALLQPLRPENGHQPFARLAELALSRAQARLALVVSSTLPGMPLGASLIGTAGDCLATGIDDDAVVARLRGVLADDGPAVERDAEDGQVRLLSMPVPRVPRLLVCGGGPDVLPLVRMADELGWDTEVLDHRPAYLDRLSALWSGLVREVAPSALPARIDADAAVVMSHHLDTDRRYLDWLADTPVPYVGLLGPAARRDRLLEALGERGSLLGARLHGPVGLDLGGRSPEAIALSILAEIQASLSRR